MPLDARTLCWHGWQLTLLPEWGPVRIEGGFDQGSIVLADLQSTRLAIRWQKAKSKRIDPVEWTKAAMASEVGQLTSEQSQPHQPGEPCWTTGRLYLETKPPGRDVWIGHESTTNRLFEIVYQSKSRSKLLTGTILPTLRILPPAGEQRWSIFDLQCVVPPGWSLQKHRLNAGDLTLTFAKKRETLVIRQLRPATLALDRQPLSKWLDAQQQIWKQFYDVKRAIESTPTRAARTIRRRRRFFYLRWIASQRFAMAVHDEARNAILIIDATDETLADRILLAPSRVILDEN